MNATGCDPARVEYTEIPAPAELRRLVKAAWTLTVGRGVSDRVRHVATPDGCMEIIRRIRGRSAWGAEQPAQFVAGLIASPAELELGGDSQFVGLRLWPWAWARIGRVAPRQLVDRWADLTAAAPKFAMPHTAAEAFDAIDPDLLDPETAGLVDAILDCATVAEIARRSGRSHRTLQRWFERNVGVPPRIYLRLLRFSNAFGTLPGADGSLAGHAADHGFADQAHMAREFRTMSGTSAGKARKQATGPFL